jgi:hypothetical protein
LLLIAQVVMEKPESNKKSRHPKQHVLPKKESVRKNRRQIQGSQVQKES